MSEQILKGLSISNGIACGTFHSIKRQEESKLCYHLDPKVIDQELIRYRQAVEKSREDIRILYSSLEEKENILILDGHLSILEDPLITNEVEGEIRRKKINAEMALTDQFKRIKQGYRRIRDPFFRQRFQEVKAIIERILRHLRGTRQVFADFPKGTILYAKAFSSFDVMEMDPFQIIAIVSETDGRGSHAAITARGRGFPFITNISEDKVRLLDGVPAIVDANQGYIVFCPNEDTKKRYQKLYAKQTLRKTVLKKMLDHKAETIDGYRIRISANIDSLKEASLLGEYPVSGVGLFRTELAFSLHTSFPSEEEQFLLYKDLAIRAGSLPVTIRTFDVGADKSLRLDHQELNPFLGCRAIRFLLKETKIFNDQLKAILRASVFGNIRILFPMVSTLQELIEAKTRVYKAVEELSLQGVNLEKIPLIGSMIEVPSSAIITDLLAQEVDFLSIGTNDLVQYALAADRTNLTLDALYSPAHPGILRLMKWAISEANHYQVPIGACGEMSSDPKFIPLLLGLGIQELSVPLHDVPVVLESIRNTTVVEAYALAQETLNLRSLREIITHLTQTRI